MTRDLPAPATNGAKTPIGAKVSIRFGKADLGFMSHAGYDQAGLARCNVFLNRFGTVARDVSIQTGHRVVRLYFSCFPVTDQSESAGQEKPAC